MSAPPPPPPPPRILVSIIVFIGDPVDYQRYRHTMLFFQTSDDSFKLSAHVTGGAGRFHHALNSSGNPRNTVRFAKEVPVGCLRRAVTKAQLSSMMYEVPALNHEPEFNCHSWVEACLRKLWEAGFLLRSEYGRGVDGMIEATMEAADE